jgi:Sulfatase-modifying factor enzyme 1
VSDRAAPAPDRTLEGMTHLAAGAIVQPDGQRVATPAFAIDTRPVSKAQFAAFMADGGYQTKRYWDRGGWAVVVKRRHRVQPLGWHADRDASSSQPVVGVNWYEADAYCRWRSKTLPSTAQWQRACRAIPAWLGTTSHPVAPWEWTAEALWKGSQEAHQAHPDRCAAQVQSHPALDGPQTGFRCATVAAPAPPAASPARAAGPQTPRPAAPAP